MDSQQKIEHQFFARHDTPASLIDAASSVCRRGVQIQGALFSSRLTLRHLVKYLQTSHARARRFKLSNHAPYLIQIPIPSHRLISPKTSFAKAFFWQDPKEPIFYLLSCQEGDLFEYLSARIHAYLLPDLCKVFLRTSEVRTALNYLARDSERVKLRVREYVSRSLIDDPHSHKKVRTKREWTDEDYQSVFEKLSEQKGWLSALTLEIRGPHFACGKIRRNSTFSCREGFPYFFNTVIKTLKNAILKSCTFFENRDRTTSPDGTSHPLKILYSQDIFSDKLQNQRLIDSLQRLSDTALSVYHPNPYLHASLIDYTDGSSYGIWVTTPSSILLIPKRKATIQSLERLCDHICDKFEEGEVRNFYD